MTTKMFAHRSHVYSLCQIPGEKDLFAVHMDRIDTIYREAGLYLVTLPLSDHEAEVAKYRMTYEGRDPECISINYLSSIGYENWWANTPDLGLARTVSAAISEDRLEGYGPDAEAAYVSVCFETGRLLNPARLFDKYIGITPRANEPEAWRAFFENSFAVDMPEDTYEGIRRYVDWEAYVRNEYLPEMFSYKYRFGDDDSREVVCTDAID